MSQIANWTAEQAWFIHQWLDQIQQEILQHHKESIRYFQWREEGQEAFIERVMQMTEEEREKEGIWLEPDDPMPF
jgi:predicted AlkP superfamily phosphohydrolase/phosphomutase